MAWTDETWGYIDLGIPESRILWKYQESYSKKGLSDEAGFVALAISSMFPRAFPVRQLINWCGRKPMRLLRALKELEEHKWIKVTSTRWRKIRNLVR